MERLCGDEQDSYAPLPSFSSSHITLSRSIRSSLMGHKSVEKTFKINGICVEYLLSSSLNPALPPSTSCHTPHSSGDLFQEDRDRLRLS